MIWSDSVPNMKQWSCVTVFSTPPKKKNNGISKITGEMNFCGRSFFENSFLQGFFWTTWAVFQLASFNFQFKWKNRCKPRVKVVLEVQRVWGRGKKSRCFSDDINICIMTTILVICVLCYRVLNIALFARLNFVTSIRTAKYFLFH